MEEVKPTAVIKGSNLVYVDALNKIQFNSNNLKLTFVETEDISETPENKQLQTTEIVKLVMSVEAAAKMANAIAKFINGLANKAEDDTKK